MVKCGFMLYVSLNVKCSPWSTHRVYMIVICAIDVNCTSSCKSCIFIRFFLYFMNIHEIIYMNGVTVYMYIDMMDNRIKA